MRPEYVSKYVLEKMSECANTRLGVDVYEANRKCVVTIPAYFTDP